MKNLLVNHETKAMLKVNQTWQRTKDYNHADTQIKRTIYMINLNKDRIGFAVLDARGNIYKLNTTIGAFIQWINNSDAQQVSVPVELDCAPAEKVSRADLPKNTATVEVAPVDEPRVIGSLFLVNGKHVIAQTMIQAVVRYAQHYGEDMTALDVKPIEALV